jgi:N-acetyl-anhydromuramyl-L-alanine amidase AmpD
MRRLAAAFIVCLLAGCAAGPRIDTTYSSVGQNSRVRYLVLHFTTTDFDESLATLTQGDVSSHYLVRDNPPTIFRLVDDNRRAWHAGASSWKGNTEINASSIGVEIVNRGYEDGVWFDYPPEQIDAAIELVRKLVRDHDISPDRILGHSDVAPQRKVDPGPRFPWKRLADAGLVTWPDPAMVATRRAGYERQPPSVAWFQQRLEQHGFAVPRNGNLDDATRKVLSAFQMKYRPARFDGEPDSETAALLDVLTSDGPDVIRSSSPALLPSPSSMLDAELSAIAFDPQHRLASLAVLAIRNGQVVYRSQFGDRFIDNARPANNKAATEETLYRVASISKLVVTLGLMRLAEDGKVSLDADVSDYLGYRLRNPHFPDAPITLRMLLSHTSSLRDDAFYFWPAKHALKDVLLPGETLHGKGEMWAANAAPGAYFSYANLNWGVIATVMERATNERFDRLMKRLILDPMGLRGGFNPAEFGAAELANAATLYCKCTEVGGKDVWNPSGPWMPQVDDYSTQAPVARTDATYEIGSNGTVFGPQGNLRISVADLGKVMRMLMNKGEHEGKQLLKTETVDAIFAPQWRYDGRGVNGDNSYGNQTGMFSAWGLGAQIFLDIGGAGYGDRLVEGGGFSGVGHLGDAYGLTGAFVFDPVARNGMIFLAGGTAFDPETYRGKYSALRRHEELVLTALYKRAIREVVP